MKYRRLCEENHEIRLLTLVKGENPAFVWCKLDHYSLTDHPPYIALSYCWGNPAITKTVMINGKKAQATVNLEAALRQLAADGYSKIWADALCINQDDIEERGRQILRMRIIYAEAYLVLAWLGIEYDNSNLAMKFINKVTKRRTGFKNPFNFGGGEGASSSVKEETKFLGQLDQASKVAMELINHWPLSNDRRARDNDIDRRKEKLSLGEPDVRQSYIPSNQFFGPNSSSYTIVEYFEFEDDETRDAVTNFFSRPYWRRVWILQEISIASEVLVCCGADSTSLENIEIVLVRTELGKDLHRRGCVPNFNAFRKSSYSGQYPSLVKLLMSSRTSLATNQKDKVYALLGLASDGEQIVPVPKYEQSFENILKQMTKSILLTGRYPNILLFRAPDRAPNERLPSWVPDWAKLSSISRPWHSSLAGPDNNSVSLQELGKAVQQFLAPRQPHLKFDGQLLVMKGELIDEVDGVTSPPCEEKRDSKKKEEECIHRQKARNGKGRSRGQDNYELILEIAKCISIQKMDFGIDGESFPQLIDHLSSEEEPFIECFSMLLDKDQANFIKNTHPNLLQWLEKVRVLPIAEKSFEDWVHKAKQIKASWPRKSKNSNAVFYKYIKRVAQVVNCGMTLASTKKWRVAMVHPQTQKGDVICTLLGCSMPAILRESDSTSRQSYHIVGEAYMHDVHKMTDFSWTSIAKSMDLSGMPDIRIE